MPQLQHPGADLRFNERHGAGRGGVRGAGGDGVSLLQTVGNATLGVQNAFALHLGGVGGQHRRNMGVGQGLTHGFVGPASGFQFAQGLFHASSMHVAGSVVQLLPADVVLVLGQVGQVAEIREGANHADRLFAGERSQLLFQSLAGQRIGIAAKRHRQSANVLNQGKGVIALLLTNHISQNAPQPSDVVHQGPVLQGQRRL